MIIRNDSNETIPGFAVMRVTGAAHDAAGQFYLRVDKPDDSFQTYYLVNGPFPIPAGKFGVADDDYPCYAAYDDGSGTPAFGDSWGAKSGSWKLAPNRDGFDVLGNSTAGRVLVRQHKVTQLIGKLAADLSSGSTASATVWLGAGGSEAASGYSATLQDWLIPSGQKLASGTSIIAHLINGVWYLTEAGACTVPE